jgi:hypothetical protein
LRCQPNLAPHFDFYRDNPQIFPLLRQPPSGILIADSKLARRISTGVALRRDQNARRLAPLFSLSSSTNNDAAHSARSLTEKILYL